MPSLAAGSFGLSAVSAIGGHNAAGDANDLSARQLALEERRDEFNQGIVEQGNEYATEDRDYLLNRRDREEGMLDPIQEGIVARANAGPDYEGAAGRSDADVTQAYGLQRDQERRRRERYGINPASGVSSAESRRVGNSEALAKVYGRNKSRLQEDDRDWARKITALGTGNLRNTAPSTQLSQLGVSGASGVLGQQAGQAGQNAAAAFGLAGNLFADGSNQYENSQSNYSPDDDTDYFTG